MGRRILAGVSSLLLVAAACSDSSPRAESPIGPGTTAAVTTVPVADPAPPAGELIGLALQQVAGGLDNPALVTAPPGDSRLFVLEQPGRIRLVADGVLLAAPFLDIAGIVASDALEQGLLALAFHPDYDENGRLFVYYTDRDGDSVLAEYRRSPDVDRADPQSGRTVLTADQPAGNHNGGMLAFGPDGYLYLSLGDGGGADDQFNNGRRPETLLGTMLRIDVDDRFPYAIPPDNPYVDGGGAREVWAYGLRNPWRFSFDAATGLLYVADVGQRRWEEVNVVPASAPGLDFGWSKLEGFECFRSTDCIAEETVVPVVVYGHDTGCSIAGGYVYRGTQIPELYGHYLYGDWCGGWVRSFRLEDGVAVDAEDWSSDLGPFGRLLSFGMDGSGELYVTADSGDVYRIVAVR